MIEIARCWRVLAGGTAIGLVGVLGLADGTASAEPVFPPPSVPNPAAVTQPVTAAPAAAPAPITGQLGVASGTAVTPGLAAAPDAQAATAANPAVPAPAPATIQPASSGTVTDFFKGKGVKMEPQVSQNFRALNIVLPMPPSWSQVPDPNVPDAFAVIADRDSPDLYTPNAQVTVYKLVGDFDPKEAISHGLVDSQQQPAWRSTDASLADFNGFPSSFIEGSYRSTNQMLNVSRRHVIAAAGPDRFLVTLSVTTAAGNQGAPSSADATDAIVSGFRVSDPAPAAAPPPAPGTPPALPPLPALPGLPGLPVQPSATG